MLINTAPDKIIVEVLKEGKEPTASGNFVLPSNEGNIYRAIIRIGKFYPETGSNYAEGDYVIFPKNCGFKFEYGGLNYMSVDIKDIVAVYKDEQKEEK